jgi:hypothetical protein
MVFDGRTGVASTRVPSNAGTVRPSKSGQTIRFGDDAHSDQLHDYPTVLVARDDDGLDGVLIDRLRREDYNVLEADSAHVFDVVRVHSRPIHLLLVDVSMDARVPIPKEYRSELRVMFVKKPVDADIVLAKVRQLLGSPPTPSSIR